MSSSERAANRRAAPKPAAQKRVASKHAVKAVTKKSPGHSARAAANKAIKKPAAGLSAQAQHLAAALAHGIADGRLDVIDIDALQALLAAACRLYGARREAGDGSLPVARNALSATDVMITASGLLRAGDLAVFELGMWQGFTGR